MDTKSQSRVLIVDDMRVNRMILSSLLVSNGVLTDLAESGEECLELCRKNKYDLILLDHRMPGIDGVDTFVQLKEIFKEQGRKVPVVCHTVEAARDNINLYKAAGFADVLIKPIQPQRISEVLMEHLPHVMAQEEQRREDDGAHLKVELEKLPEWLSRVPELDISMGMEYCDTADDYMEVLSVFAASATDKADEIERLMNEKDYRNFTLKVHSLKTVAKIVGALSLSSAALELETAGKSDDIETIKAKTPKLLVSYRALADHLALIAHDQEDKA